MRAVVQRVKRTSVTVGGELKGSAGQGFNVLIGVMQGDTDAEAQLLAAKISKLRVFEDENGKKNKSVLDIGGEILVISQFTLCADIKKGNRPSFTDSAPPEEADRLYLAFCEHLREAGVKKVETGVFAADMLVSIDNDGPVTIVMDTDIWEKRG